MRTYLVWIYVTVYFLDVAVWRKIIAAWEKYLNVMAVILSMAVFLGPISADTETLVQAIEKIIKAVQPLY